jgi:hypothetical protein
MKKSVFLTLMFPFLLMLPSCQNAEQRPIEDVFDFRQDNWSLVQDSDTPQHTEVVPPERWNGYTYQEALEIAVDNIDDPHYELVWGEPRVLSPDGSYAVYISNKDDLVSGRFSLLLLDIPANQERVICHLGDDQAFAYPLWWIDNDRFVYEQGGTYFLCDIRSTEEPISLPLDGEVPVILAYDGSTFLYEEQGAGLRQIAAITADNRCELVATVAEEQGSWMAESAINETLRLAVMKVRLLADTGERALWVYDYVGGSAAELPDPAIDGAKQIQAIDLEWKGTDLVVHYQVDETEQTWLYAF